MAGDCTRAVRSTSGGKYLWKARPRTLRDLKGQHVGEEEPHSDNRNQHKENDNQDFVAQPQDHRTNPFLTGATGRIGRARIRITFETAGLDQICAPLYPHRHRGQVNFRLHPPFQKPSDFPPRKWLCSNGRVWSTRTFRNHVRGVSA